MSARRAARHESTRTADTADRPTARGWRPGAWSMTAGGAIVALGYGLIGAPLGGVPLTLVTLAGGTVAAFGVLSWRAIDALLSAPQDDDETTPRTRSRQRELQREKQAVLRAIKEIELDFKMKKLAEADYREMTQRYRARAIALLAEIEDGGDIRRRIERDLKRALDAVAGVSPAATSDGAGPRRCPSCSTTNDSDARFCKQCAHTLV